MHRFFISPECINGESVFLQNETARQLSRVLRARSGDQIVVLDNSGWEYLVVLDDLGRESVSGTILHKSLGDGEPNVKITLYQGILKSDRFEYVLQKGTELGISAFVSVFCERSIPRGSGADWNVKRLNRWRKIIKEAAEQSRRGRIPELCEPVEFSVACDGFKGKGFIPWEEETNEGLRGVLSQLQNGEGDIPTIGVFIGPEGGFTPDEVEYAASKRIVSVSLGKRILRAETAGIVASAAILYELGELGG